MGRAFALPREQRLRRRRDFAAVLRSPTKTRDVFFSVHVQTSPTATAAQLGVAVSRRTAARAVTRNRLKRVIRESFRMHQQALMGLKLLVVVHPRAAAAGNPDLRNSLAGHWRKLLERCAHP